jgi:hypothetical protein
MIADQPRYSRQAVVSQDRGGGINLVCYDKDYWAGTYDAPDRTKLLRDTSDLGPEDVANPTLRFYGDLGAVHDELMLRLLRRALSITFEACSSGFICHVLKSLDHGIRGLNFSHCWLDQFPAEFPHRLSSFSMRHCWIKQGLLRAVTASATTITLPEESPWYEEVLPSGDRCFIVGDDFGICERLLKALCDRPPLMGLHISRVSLHPSELHQILDTGSHRISVHAGLIYHFDVGPIPDAAVGCEELDMEYLQFDDPSAVARCLRGRSTLKTLNLPPVSLDPTLIGTLASLPALNTLSIRRCTSISNRVKVTLPGVSAIYMSERQNSRRSAVRKLFPNAEIASA